MFTRRTATVTISAPDASTAAAFSSRLLYLPVPTISRELKVRPSDGPAIGLDVLLRRHSTASNEMHDLKIVAILDTDLAERRSRHDLQVTLDRDPQRIEPKPVHHLGNVMPPGTRRCSPLTRIPRLPSRLIRRADRSGAQSAKCVQGGRRAHRLTERSAKQNRN